MYQALNDRRITDSSFRQQILYTVNQVETIYWGLVQAYEDVQAKERALDQSNQLLSDNKKQLQIGTMAPLDVVNAESTVATDQQALISAQSALNYQQQIIKQAIARNLNDPRAFGRAGDSDGSREPGGAARGIAAGGGAGAGSVSAEAGAGAGGADASQRRDHAEGRAQRAAAVAGCLRVLRREYHRRAGESELQLSKGFRAWSPAIPAPGSYGGVLERPGEQHGSGQRRGLQLDDSNPQPRSAIACRSAR